MDGVLEHVHSEIFVLVITSLALPQGDQQDDKGDQGSTDEEAFEDPFAWLGGSPSQPLAPPTPQVPPPALQQQAPEPPPAATLQQQRQQQRQQQLLAAARAAAAAPSRPPPHSSTQVRCCTLSCC
jgi:hypothetical protein